MAKRSLRSLTMSTGVNTMGDQEVCPCHSTAGAGVNGYEMEVSGHARGLYGYYTG